MATREAIGRIEHGGTMRIKRFSQLLAESLSVELPELPTDRDPAYQQAVRLDMMGNWLETIARALDLVKDEPEQETQPAEEVVTNTGSKFAGLSAEQLALETDVRLLPRPDGLSITEWADWLEQEDAKIAQAELDTQESDETKQPTHSQIKRMNLSDLITYARSQGIEPNPDDTRSDIIAALDSAEVEDSEAAPESKFAHMTVPELKEYAERHEIDLGDATKKADIIEVLEAQEQG